MIKESIEQAVKDALTELGAEDASFIVSRPSDMAHGDFATNAALSAAKLLKKNPKEVADMLVENLSSSTTLGAVSKIETAGAGFINFFLSQETIQKEVEAAARYEKYGSNNLYAGKKVMVEYTQPNPFKPFHIGHLMSNTIGESIACLLERSGAVVTRANYQGDVGPHVAKAIFVLLRDGKERPSIEEIGAAYVEGNKLAEEDPEVKTEIDVINKKIYEKSDEEINALYEWGRTLSLEHFEELYKILGTRFDFYFFESETAPIGLKIVQEHPEVFVQSEGATVFKGESYGLHTRVFVNKLGLPTYETKELGLVELKRKRVLFDESITITAQEQSEYFKVVFLASKLVFPDIEGKLIHRSHGMMRFAQGKMSSRLGNVVTGESLLMSLRDAAKEKMEGREVDNAEQIAEQVAVAGIKYTVLKQNTGKDIIFDPEKSLSIEGDSGPYIQYAHVRAASLLKKAEEARVEKSAFEPNELTRLIIHYPDALARAAEELEPHYVTTYLTELASAFNSWYASERIIVDGKVEEEKLVLIKAVKNILESGLSVLGIKAPQEM